MATDVLVENVFLKKWKKPGLWDHGVATGGPGQKPDGKKQPGLSDSGMASGGLTSFTPYGKLDFEKSDLWYFAHERSPMVCLSVNNRDKETLFSKITCIWSTK